MGSYAVTKEVRFCYGHRLLNHAGKCRHLHGHSVKAAVTVVASQLDERGMVCDFAELKQVVAGFVREQLDHTLILHEADPLVPLLKAAGERFLALPDHPTAEVLARLIFDYVLAQGYPVSEVVLWEADDSYARYQG